jgi:hypothetical protein
MLLARVPKILATSYLKCQVSQLGVIYHAMLAGGPDRGCWACRSEEL